MTDSKDHSQDAPPEAVAAAEVKVNAAVRAIARLIGRQIAREEFTRRDAEATAPRGRPELAMTSLVFEGQESLQ